MCTETGIKCITVALTSTQIESKDTTHTFSDNVQNVKRTHCQIYTNAAERQTEECEQTNRALVIGLRL